MGQRNEISESLGAWMTDQPVFFVASAPLDAEGSINCSPKGNRGEFVVLGPDRVAYLDQTGSGVETIAHLRENGRLVIMFCAFAGPPRIVRLHGRGRVVETASAEFSALAARFAGSNGVGVRSIIVLDVARVSDSCGYGVPFMEFTSHRPTLDQWSHRKGPEGIREYWRTKNAVSLDGLEGLGD
ncbi:MAG TPA: pyridoxamine 5'-phosphate oxidase family protein [Acidimicrobiales bacterium]|nr:pyridoxamine 5'-phosphate oxidase family protein [Acidimicrobiales bacterium]